MSVILGITDGDDGGAVLLVDGRLVAAVNEERLNRMKMSIGFPRLAVQEVLRLGGVERPLTGPGQPDARPRMLQVGIPAFLAIRPIVAWIISTPSLCVPRQTMSASGNSGH